jgi:hypothetical protein
MLRSEVTFSYVDVDRMVVLVVLVVLDGAGWCWAVVGVEWWWWWWAVEIVRLERQQIFFPLFFADKD